MKRLLFVVIFIVSASYYSFSEMTFGINTNFNILNETYNDVNYKRSLIGFGEQFRFEVYGKNSIFGFFAQDEFGFYFSDKQDSFNSNYFSMAAGPSLIFRINKENIFASLSIGPMIQWYYEFYTVKESLSYYGTINSPRTYTTFDFGGLADLAFVIKTDGRFLIRLGITGELVFYRSESGQSIRNKDNNNFLNAISYTGIIIKPHIGIGLGYLFD
jgi:hypothetical protein